MRRFLTKLITQPRPYFTTAFEVAGFACIDFGVFRWCAIAGFITTGVSLIVIGALSA